MVSVLAGLGFFFAGVCLLVLLLLLIGFLLPEKFQVSLSFPYPEELKVKSEDVWKRINDVEKYPACGSMCVSVKDVKLSSNKDYPLEWSEDIGEGKIANKTVFYDASTKKCTREMFDPNVNMTAVWQITVREEDIGIDGTYSVSTKTLLSAFIKLTLRLFASKGISGYASTLMHEIKDKKTQ